MLVKVAVLTCVISSGILFAAGSGGTFTTGNFHNCPPEGKPKKAGSKHFDPDLNGLKNRDVPPPSYKSMTIDEIRKIPATKLLKQQGESSRKDWSQSARDAARKWEWHAGSGTAFRGVQVEGYVHQFKQLSQGPESCNCNVKKKTDMDIHINLVAKAGGKKSRSIVTEVSPRAYRGGKHAKWNVAVLKKLANLPHRVRVSGWLMWDQEHHEQLKSQKGKPPLRGTLWEIHPIHEIEYFDPSKQWRKLDEFPGSG